MLLDSPMTKHRPDVQSFCQPAFLASQHRHSDPPPPLGNLPYKKGSTGGAHYRGVLITPKSYQDPVLWVWLEVFFHP